MQRNDVVATLHKVGLPDLAALAEQRLEMTESTSKRCKT